MPFLLGMVCYALASHSAKDGACKNQHMMDCKVLQEVCRCAEYVRQTLTSWGMRPDQPLAEAQGDLEAFIKLGIEDTAREVRSGSGGSQELHASRPHASAFDACVGRLCSSFK